MRWLVVTLVVACSSSPLGSPAPSGGGGDIAGAGGDAAAGAAASGGAGGEPAGGGDVGGAPGGAGWVGGSVGPGGAGGQPPECTGPEDCTGPLSECRWPTCDAGECGTAFAAAGTTIAQQVTGDCHTAVCDGAGAVEQAYEPGDLVPLPGSCVAASYCTPSGPVHELEPDGTRCDDTCGCPEMNGGSCGPSDVTCTRGLCDAGVCVDAIPVRCQTGYATYQRCDLTAGQNSISWGAGTPECQAPGWCSCSKLALDVGYCAPGETCLVYDANGVWLGPVLGTGVCL